MPGWAGSSFYWMRYMDAKNEKEFAGQEEAYWEMLICILVETNTQMDIYCISFWNKF
jgi:leucyl-tRNA synthetase